MTNTYHHGDLKNALIEAGITLVNREGEKQLSLRKVAAMCNVSPAAPYSHFQGKEDLLDAMRIYVSELLADALEQAARSCPDPNSPEVLIRMGREYVLFFLRNPHYFSFLFSQSGVHVDLTSDGGGLSSFRPYEIMREAIARIMGQTEMTRERQQDRLLLLWATVHGLTAIATMKNVRYDKDWETKIEDIIWNK